jgi:LysR family hydrogen peroxide-inducible transcriptional activator
VAHKKIPMPTLIQLEYLVSVDTYRNFGLAAEKCFVTQPTLSMQIKKAEEELGVIVFDRGKQPVIPTDVGVEVLKQARVILQEAKRLEAIVADFRGDVSGNLRLGIIPTLAPYLLPLFVGAFTRRYPKVHLQVREQTTEQIVQDLHRDLLDVGLLVTPLKDPSIQERVLFYEEIKAYLNPTHPSATKAILENSDLEREGIWLLSEGHCFRHQMINLCAKEGKMTAKLPFEYESGSLESLRRLVDKEGGFTLLPELAIEAGHPHLRSIQSPVPLREVSLVYVRNFAKTRLLDLLAQEILDKIPMPMKQANRGKVIELAQ